MVSYVPPYIPPSLPTYLNTAKKRFFNFAKTSQIINFKYENLPYLAVKRKTFSLGKKSQLKFQKWRFFGSNSAGVFGVCRGRCAAASCHRRASRVQPSLECRSLTYLGNPVPMVTSKSLWTIKKFF